LMVEQHRMMAIVRVNNAGRLEAFLIEIPSDLRTTFCAAVVSQAL